MDRILVIDDDDELCELLDEYLGAEGFEVEAVHDGETGVERALDDDHALLVLDVMLPGINGFEVLRRIRSESEVPVLMLTARGEDVDRIVGLEVGADDYLPKPFNPRELVARIHAILRRARARERPPAPRVIEVGDVQMDTGAREIRRGGERVRLTAMEFDILEALLRAAGRVVSREDLTEEVLGRKYSPYDRSIDVHVSNLRKKLGHEVDGVERIKAIRQVGYLYTNPGLEAGDGGDAGGG